MARGGDVSRENGKKGGRPKGSRTLPKIRDYITPEEVKELIQTAKEQAKERPELLRFLLEQIFGRAPQSVNVDGNLNVSISSILDELEDE